MMLLLWLLLRRGSRYGEWSRSSVAMVCGGGGAGSPAVAGAESEAASEVSAAEAQEGCEAEASAAVEGCGCGALCG